MAEPRWGDEWVATIRERLRADMRRTLGDHGVFDDPGYDVWTEDAIETLIDGLTEDSMHVIESLVARVREAQ